MKNILILSLGLGVVCTVAAAVLGVAEMKTKDIRAEAKKESDLQAVKSVLPEFDNNPLEDRVPNKPEGDDVILMRATRDGETVAYAIQASAPGYGGKVEVLVGLNPDGAIRHVVVLPGHQETPGLGTKATDRRTPKTIVDVLGKSGETEEKEQKKNVLAPNEYLDKYNQYNLLKKTDFKVSKDAGKSEAVSRATVDAVSGATITSRAVAAAVSKAAAAFPELRKKLESEK